jgi:hypothetical protein
MSLINYIFCHFKVSWCVITPTGVANNFNEINKNILTKIYGGCLCPITNNNILLMKYQKIKWNVHHINEISKNDIVNIIFQR